MTQPARELSCRVVGRYAIFDEIAHGGMATVHLGRLVGPVGFARTVAIKRLYPVYAKDPDFVAMFLDEARLAARVRHPNVVPTLDVVATPDELFLVMEYVQGESLGRLIRQARRKGWLVPPPIAISIMLGALHGLHAAHEASNERGEPLGLVHRDVSPQNILVGIDGVARVLDFGVAKAEWRVVSTRDGQFKGKVPYTAPEQLASAPPAADRRIDVYAAAVCLWEALVGKRLFEADSPAATVQQVMSKPVPRPSLLVRGLPSVVDEVVLRGLDRDPAARFATARDMAVALEGAAVSAGLGLTASQREVGEWVDATVQDSLMERARQVAEVEAASVVSGVAQRANILPGQQGVAVPRRARSDGRPNHARAVIVISGTLLILSLIVLVGAAWSKQSTFERNWAGGPMGRAATSPPVAAPTTLPTSLSTIPSPVLAPVVSAPTLETPTASPTATATTTATSEALPATASPPSRPQSHSPRVPPRKVRAPEPPTAPAAPTPPPAPTVKPGCDSPFTVDPVTGIRKPKLECL